MNAKLPQLTDEYLLECARIFLRYSNLIGARKIYSNILKKNVRNPEALKGLGTCFCQEENWENSRKCFSAYWILTGNIDGKLWVSYCYAMLGDLKTALSYLKGNEVVDFLFETTMSSGVIPENILSKLRKILEDHLKVSLQP